MIFNQRIFSPLFLSKYTLIFIHVLTILLSLLENLSRIFLIQWDWKNAKLLDVIDNRICQCYFEGAPKLINMTFIF
jgi:hypothetical protein